MTGAQSRDLAAFERGDFNVAFQEALKGAHEGSAIAQSNVAAFYASGTGVVQDSREAEKWWRLSADQGMAAAQSSLGALYLDGAAGVARNREQAATYLLKAAEAGHPTAQYNLGKMYLDFEGGVPHDPGQAYLWFNRAAAGYQEQIEKLLSDLSSEIVF